MGLRKKLGIQTNEELKAIPKKQINDISQIDRIGIRTIKKIRTITGHTDISYFQNKTPEQLKKLGLSNKQIQNIKNIKISIPTRKISKKEPLKVIEQKKFEPFWTEEEGWTHYAKQYMAKIKIENGDIKDREFIKKNLSNLSSSGKNGHVSYYITAPGIYEDGETSFKGAKRRDYYYIDEKGKFHNLKLDDIHIAKSNIDLIKKLKEKQKK